MSYEKQKKAQITFEALKEAVSDLQNVFFDELLSLNNPQVTDTTLLVIKQAEKLLHELDELDENMDINTTKLGSIEQYFPEDSSLVKYINSRIDYITSEGKDIEAYRKMTEAVKELSVEQEEEEYSLHDHILEVEEAYCKERDDNLERIEAHLEGKAFSDEFTEKDFDLIRYYLKHNDDNYSVKAIESLSNRGLQAAYNQCKYRKAL